MFLTPVRLLTPIWQGLETCAQPTVFVQRCVRVRELFVVPYSPAAIFVTR